MKSSIEISVYVYISGEVVGCIRAAAALVHVFPTRVPTQAGDSMTACKSLRAQE